ncbi:hypothetical protein FRB99_002561 [Tulasnella sp. 403]|nr:hypothetical protein FRB99_002561 [Tulasnella sp. 403]
MWLVGPPFPYTKEHGVQWLTARKAECEQAVQDMEDGNQFVSNCPVRIIRERQDNGTDTLLGDIMICRSVFREVEDEEERERKVKENAEREVGDPDIVYSFGDFLSPTHHGRGIMTAAIRTVMEDWAIPCMGARRFEVDTLAENVASQKVFEKNGFVFAGEMKNVVDLAKMGKGEGMLGIRSFVRNGALD